MATEVLKVQEIERSQLGQGLHWDDKKQTLYFVDIADQFIRRYTPATGEFGQASTAPRNVSFIIPITGQTDRFIISLDDQVVAIFWDGKDDRFWVEKELFRLPEGSGNIITAGQCNPAKILWTGSASFDGDIDNIADSGVLLSYDEKKSIKKHWDKIRLCRGFGVDRHYFYFIDGLSRKIDRYELKSPGEFSPTEPKKEKKEETKQTTTTITDKTDKNIQPAADSGKQDQPFDPTWFTLDKFNLKGFPTGLAIDQDGNLWVSIFPEGKILKVDGHKREVLLQTVNLPVKQVTSLTFGGPSLDELYVATGAFTYHQNKSSDDGYTYKITNLGVKGSSGISFTEK